MRVHQDLRRLSPAERVSLRVLRHHVRRGELDEALAILEQLGDGAEARRAAWCMIQGGASWRSMFEGTLQKYEGRRRQARPLVSRAGWDMLDVMGDLRVDLFVEVMGHSIPVSWSERAARLFMLDCARSALKYLTPKEAAHVRVSIDVAINASRYEEMRAEQQRIMRLSIDDGFSLISQSRCVIGRHCCDQYALGMATVSVAREAAMLAGPDMKTWEAHARDVLTPLALRRLLLPEEEL